MSTARATEPVARSGPDLDVTALPSGTTLRFVLLLVLFVAGSAGMSADVANTIVGAVGTRGLDNVWGCALAGGFNPDAGLSTGLLSTTGDNVAVQACIARWVPNTLWVPFVVTPALIGVAFVVYRVLARWKGRRSRYFPLFEGPDDTDELDGLRAELDELMAMAGIDKPVRYVLDMAPRSSNAVAFGTRRRPTIRLGAGLIVERSEHPERFRTILLHELAHIRNGDVAITYATVAMWRVFLAAVLLPEAAAVIYSQATSHYPSLWGLTALNTYALVQEVLIAVLVYLARADILRTRELYADLTAIRRWNADPEVLLNDARTRPPSLGRWSRTVAPLAEIWRVHPSWLLRSRTIHSPDVLFGLDALPLFTTGLAADIALTQFGTVFYGGQWSDTGRRLIIAGLVTGIGGVAIWRAVAYAIAQGRARPSGWLAGLWLGLGMAVGELTDLDITGTRWLPSNPWVLGILVVATLLLAAWLTQFADLVIRTGPGHRPRRAMVFGLIPFWLLLTFVLSWWNDGYAATGWGWSTTSLLSIFGPPSVYSATLLKIATVIAPLPGDEATFVGLWWALPLLWLLPLLVWTVRGRTGTSGRPAPDTWRSSPSTVLRRAVRFGALGGLVCCGGLLATVAAVDTVRTLHSSQADAAAAQTWIILIISGAMIATAAIVALLRGSYPLLRALIAAGTTCLIGTAAAYLLGSVDGCLGPMNALVTRACAWQPTFPLGLATVWLPYVFGTALLAALAAAALGHGIVELVRRCRRDPAPVAQRTRHRRPRPRRVVGVVALAVTIGVVATETGYATSHPPTPMSDSDVAALTSTSAPSTHTEKLQLGAWLYYGGGELYVRLSTTQNTFAAASDTLSRATDQNFDSVWQRVVPPACSTLSTLATSAENYLPVPVASGQEIWTGVLTALGDAVTACHTQERTTTAASFSAVIDDVDNAVTAFETLVHWIGPVDTNPGTNSGSLPATSEDFPVFGDGQQLTNQGATYWFSVTDYSRNATAAAGTDQVATITVQVCLVGLPAATTLYGHPPWSPWRLVFADGRTIGPATSSSPADFGAPRYPNDSHDVSVFGVGDCLGGLVPFDIPATEHSDPIEVEFAPTHPRIIPLAWRVPAKPDNSVALGTAQSVTTSSTTGQFTVTSETIRPAGTSTHPSAARVATFTVQVCLDGPAPPETADLTWQPWTLVLADGSTVAPSALGASPYSNTPEQTGYGGVCRSGSIPFDIPAADKTDPVEIDYSRSTMFRYWTTTPPPR